MLILLCYWGCGQALLQFAFLWLLSNEALCTKPLALLPIKALA